ncbi:MAG: helix-turn-helix transcriptional regulator [Ignavibacteria bacterium]|nr:MAG: helix-turn-helix transcriptional regulator [Ignavibacteria bacterium]
MYQMKTSEEHIVKIAKALSDKSRVRILQEIAKRGRITCGDAVGIAVLSQPAVSHHIKVLVEAGLLDVEKNGRHHIISVNKKALDEFTALVSVSAKR